MSLSQTKLHRSPSRRVRSRQRVRRQQPRARARIARGKLARNRRDSSKRSRTRPPGWVKLLAAVLVAVLGYLGAGHVPSLRGEGNPPPSQELCLPLPMVPI